jgi:polyferredoxin
MDKIGKPRGLVRYTTKRQQNLKQATRIVRPRLVIYCIVMAALLSAMGYGLYARKPLQIDSLKDRNQAYKLTSPVVVNSYTIKITNKSQASARYHIALAQHSELLTLAYRKTPIDIVAGDSIAIPVTISAQEEQLYQVDSEGSGDIPITFTVVDTLKPNIKALSHNEFRFPSSAERKQLARDNAL